MATSLRNMQILLHATEFSILKPSPSQVQLIPILLCSKWSTWITYKANIWKRAMLNPPDIVCMRKHLPHHPTTPSCQRMSSSPLLWSRTDSFPLIPAQVKHVYMALGRLLGDQGDMENINLHQAVRGEPRCTWSCFHLNGLQKDVPVGFQHELVSCQLPSSCTHSEN